jgi:hypothetical protein
MSSGPDRRSIRGLALLLAPLLLLSLSCERLTPEERVRRLIDEALVAAREGDQERIGEMISERFRDARGKGKPELMALLGFHLCQEESLYLLGRVRSIRRTDAERVEAQLLLGAAGVPIEDLAELNRYSADLLLIDIVVEKEERTLWRVVEAAWRRAEPADLL